MTISVNVLMDLKELIAQRILMNATVPPVRTLQHALTMLMGIHASVHQDIQV